MNRYELKKTISKVLLIIPIVIIRFFRQIFFGTTTSISVYEYFFGRVFGIPAMRAETQCLQVIESMLEVVIFVIMFGNYIYSFFQDYNIYVIIRENNIKKWYKNVVIQLLMCCIAYIGIFFAITYCMCIANCDKPLTIKDIILPLASFILVVLFTYDLAMLVNILALKFKQIQSFMITFVGVALLTIWVVNFEKVPLVSNMKILLWLNPIENMQLSWNLNPIRTILSIVYYIILSIMITICGEYLYIKSDMGMAGADE